MPYSPPTPDQARAYHRSYTRRQVGFVVLNAVCGGALFLAVTQGEALAARPGGMPAWFVGICIAGIMAAFVAGTVIWRCPRCSIPFGRRFSIDECPECHLHFE